MCVCVYKIVHYSAIKRMKFCHLQQCVLHLESIMLSEMAQAEKDH